MKPIFLILLFAACLPAQSNSEDRQFATKSVARQFPDVAEAANWRLDSLPFKDWLQAVTFPNCEPIHSSETEEFYFAVFRSGAHLIFWAADRKARYKSSDIEVTAEGRNAKSEQEPTKWVVLKFQSTFPSGALRGQSLGTVFKIKDGLRGDLTVRYRVGVDKATQEVFEQAIPWKR